ncbi:MAG: hypothetical protein NVSMB9_10710 [Isosphaeraceae bacterium]
MEGIQSHTTPTRSQLTSAFAPPLISAKTPSDYFRAVCRRIWLVLLVGVPMSVAASVWAVRQPSVYRASAQIQIEPPQFDPVLSTLVSHEVGRHDPEAMDKYLPNRVAYLKSKSLAQEVVNSPDFPQGDLPSEVDAAEHLVDRLMTKITLGSNFVTITLEGDDPARTAKQLSTLLTMFYKKTKDESATKNDNSRTHAAASLHDLERELKENDSKILKMLQRTSTIGPGGKNIIQAEYENIGSMLLHKRMRLDEVQQQAWISQLFPKQNQLQPEDTTRLGQIERLQETRRKLTGQLQEYKRIIRNFESDPSVRHTSSKLKMVLDQLELLRTEIPRKTELDPSETIVESMRKEIESAEEASKSLLGQLRESMPEYETFLALKEEREHKLKRISDMQVKLSAFEMLSQSQSPPVTLYGSVQEPTTPVRPRRGLNIVLGIVISFGLGVLLVCMLEHIDHSVKVPEHLTTGLNLPLLGVVPRIRRTALTHRGGHLWTLGAPGSIEADAFRNVRASLLGASDRIGPIVTLLVTSAKAGEGKSTTALNVAATCARAGERTLLMDVDLRRPSLDQVFQADRTGEELGLVDVLRGDLPWQRTVIRTDVPNLDFIQTGNSREIPIEILGTLELRQLLLGLANHYDRIILDGPAVLGLADCRMIGRVVDAAVLVVRSGKHEMRPLQRAKSMLEQSGVILAGVVFNGLYEDLENWSSYGPYQAYGENDFHSLQGPQHLPSRSNALPVVESINA